ncbi:hypothetical protein DFS33DRAFT_353334 [Desarmillaria ectypa]|nr:hypothetical protein DFS33DRAFT_353334 [Desarmillaria ectypa]
MGPSTTPSSQFSGLIAGLVMLDQGLRFVASFMFCCPCPVIPSLFVLPHSVVLWSCSPYTSTRSPPHQLSQSYSIHGRPNYRYAQCFAEPILYQISSLFSFSTLLPMRLVILNSVGGPLVGLHDTLTCVFRFPPVTLSVVHVENISLLSQLSAITWKCWNLSFSNQSSYCVSLFFLFPAVCIFRIQCHMALIEVDDTNIQSSLAKYVLIMSMSSMFSVSCLPQSVYNTRIILSIMVDFMFLLFSMYPMGCLYSARRT